MGGQELALADPGTQDASPTGMQGEDRKYLTFIQGDARYGISIAWVREIIEYGVVTRVPMTPGHVRGVINLRGSVVPIVDLGRRLGLEGTRAGKRCCNIIVEVPEDDGVIPVGIAVDAVDEVLAIQATAVEPPPPFGTDVPADLLYGIGRVDGRFVSLLDLEKTLALEQLARWVGAATDFPNGKDAAEAASAPGA